MNRRISCAFLLGAFVAASPINVFHTDPIGLPVAKSAEPNCNFNWRVRAPAKTERINKGRIRTKKDTPCTTKHIGWVGGNWTYHGIKIKSQPENGRLSKVGKLGIRFVPKPGFSGSDTADLVVQFRDTRTNEVYPNIVRIQFKVR